MAPGAAGPTPGARSTLVLGGLLLAAVVSTRWVRLNVSPSVPYGLYALTRVPAPLPRGTLVLLPVPRPLRVWQTMPLLKPVAAVAGDTVCVDAARVVVDGVAYGPVLHEARGHALPVFTGCHVVPPGHVFLASTVPRSLDGRYLGMTPLTALTAGVTPLITWREQR